jgi:hypothetical protein
MTRHWAVEKRFLAMPTRVQLGANKWFATVE